MSQPIPIALVSEFYPHEEGEAHGGVEMRVWHIAQELSEAFEVHVITSREIGTRALTQQNKVTIHRTGRERPYVHGGHLADRYQFMRSIPKEIMRIKPRIIDAQSLVTYQPCIATGISNHIPIILTIHDIWRGRWLRLFGISGLIGEVYERFILRKSWTHAIANSNVTAHLLKQSGIDTRRISIIPNGIDTKPFSGIEQKYDKPTICCISRLVDYKRVSDLIEAVYLLKNKLPTIICKIIGVGPDRGNLETLIHEKGLDAHVQLLGYIEDRSEMIRILKRSHVFCLTSGIEGFGMVLLEAMAAQLPCVASDIPAVREVSDDGSSAALYELGNVKQLADTLEQVLSDSNRAQQLKMRSVRTLERYTWGKIGNDTKELYLRYL